MSIGKWVGIGAGWFFGGPIGAIIGYYIGKNFFTGKNDNEKAYEVSLLILASLVIKADGKVRKEELNYVKEFFTRTFGLVKSKKYYEIFNTLNKQSLSSKLRAICLQLTQSINHASRLQIIHFLFGVASSDNEIHQTEINVINKIATYLNVSSQDLDLIIQKNKLIEEKKELDPAFHKSINDQIAEIDKQIQESKITTTKAETEISGTMAFLHLR